MKQLSQTQCLCILRYVLGGIFAWAFLDKFFGLGMTTARDTAWMLGGSPTEGFLTFATSGPFAPLFQLLAGQLWVDIVFMLGLAVVGLTLLIGRWMHIGTWVGIGLMILMYLAVLPPAHNPIIDEHLVYAVILYMLYRDDSNKKHTR